ncbi:ComEC/Rec2 family competence protein [Oleiharenicola lentus]|uniref:ComEC/Rec2 family competence protein n=1 Tax=Oleiharenicola lentus TaxID=2508720 RepID=UPI003F66BFA2
MYTLAPWIRAALLVPLLSVSLVLGYAQELTVRVVDVGAGECVVVKAPAKDGKPRYMVYDAGNGKTAFDTIQDIIPSGSTIELLVLSHSDADHLGAVPEILDDYRVKRIIHSGYRRTTDTWKAANQAILDEEKYDGAKNIDLSQTELVPGSSFRIGDATAVMVSGFHKPPADWDIKTQGEERNAGSVVVRLVYGKKSVLLCGDAVGRHIEDADDVCLAAEKFMVDNAEAVTIDSDVIVAPHHGADNGSSTPFIEAVSPEYVIFPAGHKHQHPTKSAAQRYLAAKVSLQKIFRTDRGDHEKGPFEWDHQRKDGESDRPGDDDVEIKITATGALAVKYLNP